MKLGCDDGWTTSVTVVVCERLPLVAVINGCEVPVVVLDAVLIASRARSRLGGKTLDVVPSLRSQLADDPPGRLVTFNATAPANPFSLFTVTVYVAVCPRLTVWLAGVRVIEKSDAPPAANPAYAPSPSPASTPSSATPSLRRVRFGVLFRGIVI
jgi:hypothetical protein